MLILISKCVHLLTIIFLSLKLILHTLAAALTLYEISAVDRAIAAKICTMVVCDVHVIYKTVYLDFPK